MILSVKQVASRLNVSPRRVRALIGSGRLPATRFAGVWLIEEKSLALVQNRKPGRPITRVKEPARNG